jgi:CHAD domain-containing protein
MTRSHLDDKQRLSPGVTPYDLIGEAGRKVLQCQFTKMENNEEGTKIGDDIEALHDMRVATRRMRVAMSLFGCYYDPMIVKPIRKGLRKTGKALGRVRDLDVFIEKMDAKLNTISPDDCEILAPMRGDWLAKRESAREKMLVYLDSERYHKFKAIFCNFLKTQGSGVEEFDENIRVRILAPKMIAARMENVLSLKIVLQNPSVELLHALRIAFKQLRYTIEFFHDVLGKEIDYCITAFKLIQDHLGDINDANVALDWLSKYVGNLDFTNEESSYTKDKFANSMTEYIACIQFELSFLIDSFPETWDNFDNPIFRQRLGEAISLNLVTYKRDL